MRIDYTRWLAVACAIHIGFAATNFGTFWHSSAYVAIGVCLAGVAAEWRRDQALRAPRPPAFLLFAAALWTAWSALSFFWSNDPALTKHQLKAEIVDNVVLGIAFYVAASSITGLRRIAGGILIALSVLSVAACTMALLPGGWDPIRMHAGNGSFSTFIALASPWAMLLLVSPPIGFGATGRARIGCLLFIPPVLASARLTEARIIWVALFASLVISLALAGWRWPRAFKGASLGWYVLLSGIALAFGMAFMSAAEDRATTKYPPNTSIERTLAKDPRLRLWPYVIEKIQKHPLAGYGFGREVIAAELTHDLRDPLFGHAHNVFLSQWLQTGAVGACAFALVLIAFGGRFFTYLRSPPRELAIVGLLGLVVLSGFVVKNLTDDFLFGNNARQFWCMLTALLGCGERLMKPVVDHAGGDGGSRT